MRIAKLGLSIACVVAALAASSAMADTLQLRDGRVIQGRFVEGNQSYITIISDNRTQQYPVDQVLSITFTPAPAPQAAASAPSPAPAQSALSSTNATTANSGPGVTVPAGTSLLVRMIDGVDSNSNHVGDRFQASLEQDLVVNGELVAARGADVYGRLGEAKEVGRFGGKSELRLELTQLMAGKQLQPIVTGDYEVSGASRGGDTAKKVGGGAVLGAIVGAIAGGGKGAAVGAGVGAGAGATVQVLTKGEQVRVPSETLLEFRLEQPFTFQPSR